MININDKEIYLITTTPGEDSSNSVGISWHCNKSGSYLKYKEIDGYEYNIIYPHEEYWSVEEYYEDDDYQNKRYVCNVSLSTLKPDTKYIYNIILYNVKSEDRTFVTTNNSKKYSFISFADFQYSNNPLSIELVKTFTSHNPSTNLVICSGDFACTAGNEYSHRSIFDSGIFNNNILAFGVGDHEYWGKNSRPYIQFKEPYTYNKLFNNPKNGPIDYLNRSYYFKYNSILFIFIDCGDSNISSDNIMFIKHKKWLERVLSNNNSDFIIVCMHKSLYGAVEQDLNVKKFSSMFIEIFDKYNVNLVISGHDHEYSRTYSIKNNAINIKGTIYLDLGSSGNKLRSTDNSIKESLIHCKYIDIKQNNFALGLLAIITNNILKIEIRNQYYDLIDCFEIII